MQFLDIFTLYATLASIFFLFLTGPKILHHVRAHGPAPWATKAVRLNARFFSLFSLCLFLSIVQPSKPLANRTGIPLPSLTDSTLRYIYHFSTISDSVSALLTLSAGGGVSRHSMGYHLTLPYLSFTRILQHSAGWRVFAAVNTLHNTLRHAVLGGLAALRPVLPITGCAQLTLGMATDIYLMGLKHGVAGTPVWPNFVSACVLGVYLLLY